MKRVCGSVITIKIDPSVSVIPAKAGIHLRPAPPNYGPIKRTGKAILETTRGKANPVARHASAGRGGGNLDRERYAGRFRLRLVADDVRESPRQRRHKEAVPFLRYRSLKRLRGASSSQASLRHPKVTAYRCFLPDLTGFTASRRARPSHQRRLPRSSLQATRTSRKAVNPAIADCGCRAPLTPRLARPQFSCYATPSHSVKRFLHHMIDFI